MTLLEDEVREAGGRGSRVGGGLPLMVAVACPALEDVISEGKRPRAPGGRLPRAVGAKARFHMRT